MNIAIIIPEMVSLGGGQRTVYELSKIWQKKHDVTIYTLFYNPASWTIDNIVYLKEKDRIESAFNLYAPFEIRKLEKITQNHDIYNSHLFPANWFGKKPQAWYAHDPPRLLYDLREDVLESLKVWQRPVLSAYLSFLTCLDQKKTLKNVDSYIGNSKFCANYLEEVYGIKADYIYPGVDIKAFKVKKPRTKNILTVNRLNKIKRVDTCIHAMKYICYEFPDAKLRIVGSGPEEGNLKKLAKELNLDKNISFLGSLSENELIKEYENCYAVVFTPKREPFGLVPLEAGAAEKPVVAVDESGCKETVVNGKTGFLVEPNPKSIARATIKLLKDEKLAWRMGRAGRKRAEKFTWKKTAKELLKILKRTADENTVFS